MGFLETITFFGYDVLVPINRIQYVNISYDDKGWKIVIKSDNGDWEEHFGKDEKKLNKRYNMIKEIIGAK